jgi:hypothetical protein
MNKIQTTQVKSLAIDDISKLVTEDLCVSEVVVN